MANATFNECVILLGSSTATLLILVAKSTMSRLIFEGEAMILRLLKRVASDNEAPFSMTMVIYGS